jgi:hypothetical protein
VKVVVVSSHSLLSEYCVIVTRVRLLLFVYLLRMLATARIHTALIVRSRLHTVGFVLYSEYYETAK